jgi:hypothetical protein
MKAAIVILTDAQSGSDEATGRVFNALAAAQDFKQRRANVQVVFQGAGTRWPSVLANREHPAHGLYESVKDLVGGVSCGCADVFGATGDVEACGLELATDLAIPGTRGLASIAGWIAKTRCLHGAYVLSDGAR